MCVILDKIINTFCDIGTGALMRIICSLIDVNTYLTLNNMTENNKSLNKYI